MRREESEEGKKRGRGKLKGGSRREGGGGECKGERRRRGRISKEKVRMWRKKLPKKTQKAPTLIPIPSLGCSTTS